MLHVIVVPKPSGPLFIISVQTLVSPVQITTINSHPVSPSSTHFPWESILYTAPQMTRPCTKMYKGFSRPTSYSGPFTSGGKLEDRKVCQWDGSYLFSCAPNIANYLPFKHSIIRIFLTVLKNEHNNEYYIFRTTVILMLKSVSIQYKLIKHTQEGVLLLQFSIFS